MRWDWENNGNYDTTWSTTETATHIFGTASTHTVRLQVMDTDGLITTTRQVTMSDQTTVQRVFLPLVLRNY